MILFLFLVGVVAIMAIARYNEDDRLFWKLLVSFTLAFTVTSLGVKIMGNEDKSNSTTQVCPTQALYGTSDIVSPFTDVSTTITVTDTAVPVPVSQDTTPENGMLADVFGEVLEHPPIEGRKVSNISHLSHFKKLITAFCIDSS